MMQRQKSFDQKQPCLYLVATPIGNLEEITPRAISILKEVDVIAAEDTRNTRKLLTHFDIHTRLIAHHKHNERTSAMGLVQLLQEGKQVALVSDAGYPLISDPGQVVSEIVIQAGFGVIPISGANAMLNALVASGLPAQPFMFYGFLEPQEKEMVRELHALKEYPQTLIFYEAPHRVKKTLERMLYVLGDRRMCLARELTKRHEEFIRGTISEILDICEECKGEMVLVIAGNNDKKERMVDMAGVHQMITDYMEHGLSSKEAIKKTAKELGLSKNELYKSYHALHS